MESVFTGRVRSNWKILILEDNLLDYRVLRRQILRTLSTSHYSNEQSFTEPVIEWVTTYGKAISLVIEEKQQFDVAFCDLQLPDLQGIVDCSPFAGLACYLPVIMISGHIDSDITEKLLGAGIQDYISKDDLSSQNLLSLMRYAIARHGHPGKVYRTLLDEQAKNHKMNLLLASACHELRAPLTSILGYSQIVQSQIKIDEDSAAALAGMKRAGDTLLRIAEDVLDISRRDFMSEPGPLQEIEPLALLEDVLGVLAYQAMERGVQLCKNIHFPERLSLYIDPTGLKQILLNLIENAIKYCSRGRVEISLSICNSGDSLEVQIQNFSNSKVNLSDSLDSQNSRLFNTGDQKGPESTGLGLYIVERLCALMNGNIVFTQTSLRTFEATIKLPVIISDDGSSELQEPDDTLIGDNSVAGRILVVEGSAASRRLITHFLSPYSIAVDTAEDPEEALFLIKSRRYNLALIDCELENTSGDELAQRIKIGCLTPPSLIAITAAQPNDREPSRTFDGVLTRPFTSHKLLKVVSRFLKTEKGKIQPILSRMIDEGPSVSGIVCEFIDNVERMVDDLVLALMNQEKDRCRFLLHRLKAGETFGFPQLTVVAEGFFPCLIEEKWEQCEEWMNRLIHLKCRMVAGKSYLMPIEAAG